MKQTLHIFAKDTRRFWPEILISLAITAAFACIYPYHWRESDPRHSLSDLRILGSILSVLVPVTWWLLIARVIHAETLVGDRQFWLTRPYEWKKLLAAKLLFLFAFLYLPICIAQSVLLVEAGFQPFSYIPGLLYNLLQLTAILVLPILALAVVTSTFARMILTLLGIYFCIAVSLSLSAFVPKNHVPSVVEPSGNELFTPLLIAGGCAAAVGLQYALRNVWVARSVLIAIPVLLIMTYGIARHITNDEARMERTYPPLPGGVTAPIQLSSYQNSRQEHEYETYADTGGILVHLQLKGSGVAEGYLVIADDVKAAIEAPNGSRWTSAWEGVNTARYLPGEQYGSAVVYMPREVYNKFHGMPLTVHLSLALTQAKVSEETRIPLRMSDFSVPDFGICSPLTGLTLGVELAGISCRSALRDPELTHISIPWSDVLCSAPNLQSDPSSSAPAANPTPDPAPGATDTRWVGALDREPAEFGIAPITQVPVMLSNNYGDARKPLFLCPGTPITFTQYRRVGRTQIAITIQDFHLPDVTIVGSQVHAVNP